MINSNYMFKSLFCEKECRLEHLLELSLKFVTKLLQTEEEEDLWALVLVAITSAQGLKFNRAFIFKKEEARDVFRGVTGLGPLSFEEAHQIWSQLEVEKPSFEELIARARQEITNENRPIVKFAKELSISFCENSSSWQKVFNEQKVLHLKRDEHPEFRYLFEKLEVNECALAPIKTPMTYGFILVDNFVTKKSFSAMEFYFLETISALTSIALQRLWSYKELLRQKHLLLEAERISVIGELSSKIFHEIRNPVSALGGLSKVLLKKEVPEGIENYLKTMVREAERLENVLKDLFQFMPSFELKKEPVRLYRLLQSALVLFLGVFKEKGIHVSFECLDGDPIVNVDPKEMQLVFINILKNILETLKEGGSLQIITDKDQEGIKLKIIAQNSQIKQKTFHKFPSQITKGFSEKSVSGLGLSLAKRMIELHGGRFSVEYLESSGMEIIIFFPKKMIMNGEDA
ncbi:histidine kinase [Thermodesulfatator indicus DSM 15286]|uniref:histidine kinase n=1 Tax=Thermodesulfatator indicus (strain DSM 15286 / JCM 11887 / CIR29812) TaxID=667014 RepID=F8ACX3_THEID|nr:histidine kinase dimerization/phospho-acceptor domain-containing protein [Thermodesulfatator indicus]AEH44767.1 histidine kinase [Thermodesulfatator indicus DSM 15286]